MFVVAFFILLLYYEQNVYTHQDFEHCTHTSKLQGPPATYYMTGLFPVYLTATSRMIHDSAAYMEIMKYIIEKYNKKTILYNVSYIFYDTCGSKQPDLTIQLGMDIISKDRFDCETIPCVSSPLAYHPLGWNSSRLDTQGIQAKSIYAKTKVSNASRLDAQRLNSQSVYTKTTCSCKERELFDYHIGVVGASSSVATGRLYSIFSGVELPMISYLSTNPDLSIKKYFPQFLRTIPSDVYQLNAILSLLLNLDWSYISFLASDDDYGRAGCTYFDQLIKPYKICLAVQRFVDTSDRIDLKDILLRIKDHPKSKIVILWGMNEFNTDILNTAGDLGMFNHTWILPDIASKGNRTYQHIDQRVFSGSIGFTQTSRTDKDIEKYIDNLKTTDLHQLPWWKIYFEDVKLNITEYPTFGDIRALGFFTLPYLGYVKNAVLAYLIALENYVTDEKECDRTKCRLPSLQNRSHFFAHYLKNISLVKTDGVTQPMFDENGDSLNALFDLWNVQYVNNIQYLIKVGEWDSKTKLKIDQSNILWSENAKPQSRCSSVCSSGFYPVYHSKKCCWECIRCAKRYVKPNHGNKDKCKQCAPLTVSNLNRTECLQLYFQTLTFHSPYGYCLCACISFGLISVLFALFTFVKYRTTGFVRSANYKLSLFYLTVQLFFFLSMGMFYLPNSDFMCSIKLYIFSYLEVLLFTSILLKTELLIRIFHAKRRIDRSDKRTTRYIELFIILVISIFFACIHFYFYHRQPIKIKEIIFDDSRTIQFDCSMESHFIFSCLYIIIIALICGVQAYRTRTLPEMYSESTLIMYAVFISAFNILLLLILVPNAKTPEQKSFMIQCIGFSVNISTFLIMYSCKLYHLWCLPPGMKHRSTTTVASITSTELLRQTPDFNSSSNRKCKRPSSTYSYEAVKLS